MGTFSTYVIARWDHPLTELEANTALDGAEPDEGFSWTRPDGWQCFAPDGSFYGNELLPPIEEIEREVGGPVLGLGLAGTHWEVGFILRGERCWIASGGSDEHPAEHFESQMANRWGSNWPHTAAAALDDWASAFAHVDVLALSAVLTVTHLQAEGKLADLQCALTLAPEPGDVWWDYRGPDPVEVAEVPQAFYAIDAYSLSIPDVVMPLAAVYQRGLVLAFTASGVGIWDRRSSAWYRTPDLAYGDALTELSRLLVARGWYLV
jgi:hypothetical protein